MTDNNSPEQPRGISFKQFIDQSTNILTVFGILNALFIYASTIPLKQSTEFLLPSLFILSLVVWFELIVFAIESNNGSIKYEIFYFCACIIELGLIIYFVAAFPELLILVGIMAVFFLYIYGIMRIILATYPKRYLTSHARDRKAFIFIIIIISIILATFPMWLTIKISAPLLKDISFPYQLLK